MGDPPQPSTLTDTVEASLFDAIRTQCFMVFNNSLKVYDGHMTMGFVDMTTTRTESERVCTCSAPITWTDHVDKDVTVVIMELITDLNRGVRVLHKYGAYVTLQADDEWDTQQADMRVIVDIRCTVPIAPTDEN